MIPFQISFVPKDGDKSFAWPELDYSNPNVEITTVPPKIAVLEGGTASGRASVALRVDTEHGQVIICQTSARLFVTAAKAILAKYPGLMDD